MAGDRKLKVEILGDGSGAEKALGDVAKSGESSGGRLSSALSSAMGQLGLPFTGAVDAFGKHLDDAGGKSTSFGQKVSSAAQGITLGTGAAVAAAAGMAVHLAMNYDSATSQIAASAGISVGAAKQIGAAFLSTGGSTTFTAQEMATAYASVAGQLGATQGKALSAKQALDVMKASTDLAEGSGTDLATSTSSLSATMQAFGLKAADASSASDILYNTARVTGTGIDGVTGTFQKLHSTLGAVTPDIGQVGGIMVDLAQHGETGRKALSAINTSLNGLLAPSKSATDAQKLFGVTVFDSSGKFIGFSQLIGELKPKLAGMSQEQQLATLKAVGFGTANKALLTTIMAGPGAFQQATAAVSKSGAAHDAAEKSTNNLKGQTEKLKAGMLDLGTRIGEALIPKLLQVEKVAADVIKWFEKHKTAAEALGIAVGVVLAGAITIYVTNLAIAGVKSAIEFGKMIAKAAAWVVSTAASIAQSAALWAMYGAQWVAKAAADTAKWVATQSAAMVKWAAQQASSVASSLALWAMYGAQWVAKQATSMAKWAAENIAKAATVLAANVASAASTAAAWVAANAAMLLATAGIGLAIAAVIIVAVEIAKHWKQITHAIAQAWDWVRTEAVRIWGLITGFFKKWWPEIIVVMTGGAALLPVLLIKYWKQISSDVSAVWNDIVSFFTGIPGKIVSALSALGSDIAGVATTAWNAFTSAISAGWNAEVSFWTGLPGKILTALGDAASWLLDTGTHLVDGLINGISAAWHKVWDFIKSKLGSLVNSVMGFFGISSPSKMFHGFGVNLMEGLASGISAGSGTANDAMSQATSVLADFSIGGSSSSMATGRKAERPRSSPGVAATAAPTTSSAPSGNVEISIVGYNLSDPHQTAAEISWRLATAPVG